MNNLPRYNGFMPNDFVNGEGVCVSVWMQGCPHHCPGCFNQETWDFDGGYEIPSDIFWRIEKAIIANGITRNVSILGGEPLTECNALFIEELVTKIKVVFPTIKIFLWTGYTFEELKERNSSVVNSILDKIDVLIDGRFVEEKKDLTLRLRGSSNQHIYEKKNGEWIMTE